MKVAAFLPRSCFLGRKTNDDADDYLSLRDGVGVSLWDLHLMPRKDDVGLARKEATGTSRVTRFTHTFHQITYFFIQKCP